MKLFRKEISQVNRNMTQTQESIHNNFIRLGIIMLAKGRFSNDARKMMDRITLLELRLIQLEFISSKSIKNLQYG